MPRLGQSGGIGGGAHAIPQRDDQEERAFSPLKSRAPAEP
jgi:hypothetical protein